MKTVKRRREVIVLTALLTDLYACHGDDVDFTFTYDEIIDIRNNLDYESTELLSDEEYELQLNNAYNATVLFDCEELHTLFYTVLTKFIDMYKILNTDVIRFTN